MKKIYKLRNLDCGNCAAKMEAAIARLPEVEAVTVSFLLQRLTVCYAAGASEQEALGKIKGMIAKVEPDCEVLA